MSQKNWPVFWGMVVFALAFVFAALIAAGTAQKVKRAGDVITVTGSAKKPIRSDFVIWSGNVTGFGATRELAYKEVQRHAGRLKEYFQEQKVPEKNLTFQALQTVPQYDYRPVGTTGQTRQVLTGYQIEQPFRIESADVDFVTDLSRDVTELVKEGVPLNSYSPEYLYTKIGELRIEMLGEATQDAKARAQTMAQSVGSSVGVLRSVRSGVFQITPRHSTQVSDYGMYDTYSLEKDITAVVKATFAVE